MDFDKKEPMSICETLDFRAVTGQRQLSGEEFADLTSLDSGELVKKAAGATVITWWG